MLLFRRAPNFLKTEKGAVLPFVAIAAPLFILFLALVVDLGLARLTSSKLQITADSAALAGAAVLPLEVDVEAEALLYAQKNYDADNGNPQPVLHPNDIRIGNWDSDARVFLEGGVPINAVRVVTRRDANNANRLPSVFAGIAGVDFFDISETAVALNGAGVEFPCIGGGILSNDETLVQSDNTFNSFCLYGDILVGISGNNTLNEGTVFAMPDEEDYFESVPNTYFDFENQIISAEWTLPNIENINTYINDLQTIQTLPPSIPYPINNVVTVSTIQESDTIVPNTLYIVSGDVTFGSNVNISNAAIVAEGEIKTGSNSVIENMVLMSEDKITFQSDNRIGLTSPCSTANGEFNMYVFARDNVEFQSNNEIYGVQVATLGELKIESDNTVIGMYAEADQRASLQGNSTYGECPNGLGSAFGPLTGALVPGDQQLVLVD